MRDACLKLVAGDIPLTHGVLDGHVGHHKAVPRARQGNWPVISTRRGEAARSFPYRGPDAGRGPPRTDGHTVEDDKSPGPFRQETPVAGHLQTRLSQAARLHQELAPPLPVVISAKTHLQTQARGHVLRFSRDLELAYAPRVEYYGVRFQIELNCREAKQSWGLEDFMHVTSIGVAHAAHRSLCMVNVAYQRRTDVRQRAPDDSVLDVTADCRGYTYGEETIKLLPETPEPIL